LVDRRAAWTTATSRAAARHAPSPAPASRSAWPSIRIFGRSRGHSRRARSQFVARVVDDDGVGNHVPQLLAFLRPQEHEVQDEGADSEGKERDDRHDEKLADELAQGHASPPGAYGCREIDAAHAKELFPWSRATRPHDQRPDGPPDEERHDDEQDLEQVA